MCGITGTYNFHRAQLQKQYTQQCLVSMRHRGPDAQQTWDNGSNYIAGFARLAIRDVSVRGNQPMLSDDNNYCISFNGEIYNTAELVKKLRPYRSSYDSACDTEILLYSLIHLGIEETLQTADGMFAFAFFSVKQNKLVLARDRVGIKPLYIGKSAEGIVYSSQYDHIINHPFIQGQPFDESTIAAYLSLGYMPENSGIVTNTYMLPHGSYAIIKSNDIQLHTYFTYSALESISPGSLEAIIEQSVKEQLVSDVPVGTFMSGGTDSALISYFAGKHLPLQAFTIGIPDNRLDESAVAAEFAHLFKIAHACKYITEGDLQQLIKDNACAFSEPFADPSSLPALLLSQFAKQQVTVALSGDGGDELFWGYPRSSKALAYLPFYRKNRLYRITRLIIDKYSKPSTTDIGRHWKQESLMAYYYSSLFITGASYWLPKIYKAKALKPHFYNESNEQYNIGLSESACMNLIRKMEIDVHLQRILLKVDRAGMYHSLEVRVPLLSNNLLSCSQSFTYKDCITNGHGKIPLKKLLIAKSNEALVMQPKKGFAIPIDKWIRTELRKDVREKILDMPAVLSVAFNKNELAHMLALHDNKTMDCGWFIWAVYSLVLWHDAHVNKFADLPEFNKRVVII